MDIFSRAVNNRFILDKATESAYNLKLYQKDAEVLAKLAAVPEFRWLLVRLGDWNYIKAPADGERDEGRRACVLDIYDKLRQISVECSKSLIQAQIEYLDDTEALLRDVKAARE